jgi:hypothetical protein
LPALCANGGLALLAVAVLLALQLALARFLSAGRLQQPDSLARLRAGLSMPVLLLALLLLFPGGNADPAAAPPLATLAAGFASTEQRAHAGLVLSSLLGAGAGAWWLSQPRRYRLSRRSPAAG